MLRYLKQNSQLYYILSTWLLVGMFLGPFIYVLIPVTLILLERKKLYAELLIGFLFILILADNVNPAMKFAENIKNIYILFLAYFFFRNKEDFAPLNYIYKIFIPFFIFASICIIYSPVIDIAIQKTVSYAIVMLVIPNYFTKCYRENGQAFVHNMVLFGAIMLLVGFVFMFRDPPEVFVESGRFRGIFGNPNGLGLFCFVYLILCITVYNVFPYLFAKREKIFIYLLILASLFLSQSRNALVGCFIFFLFERFFKKLPLLGFVFLLAGLFINALIVDQLPFLIMQFGLENFLRINTLTELSGRSVAWHFVWEKIQNDLFIGHGFGYDEALMRRNYNELSRLGHQGGVHNSYLSLWLNFGLIGLIIYFRSFLLFFFKAAKNNGLALPIMYAILFSATFEGLLIGSLNPHMFCMLVIFALISENEFQQQEQQQPELTQEEQEQQQVIVA